MTLGLPRARSAFDEVASRLEGERLSALEDEVLAPLWSLGEDAWLREDVRFRRTPWGRWVLSDRLLANDALVSALRAGRSSELSLAEQLGAIEGLFGRRAALCPADPRLRLDGDRVRLSPDELTRDPLLEDALPLQQYTTHLPVLTLSAAAASLPAGEWGSGAPAQAVEPLGWLRVDLDDRRLNRRMFVARVVGHSMDDGRSGIEDGSWAVFEFSFHEGQSYDPGAARPVVLVRGAFSDPECGAYAVKQWCPAVSGPRLLSLNPDKERYPDIVVPPEEASDVRVVATLAATLRASDFARRPKPSRRPGRRDLQSPAALDELGRRLARQAARFFDGAPAEDGEGADEPAAWSSRLACLDADDGGLCLEIGPLTGLPPYLKRLRVVGQEWKDLALAANARHQPLRVPVPPGSGPWRWEAVDFEDDPDSDLSALGQDAVAPSVVVFRVDAEGVGRPVAGRQLCPGQRYRVLLPPEMAESFAELGGAGALTGGWRLWELAVPLTPPPELRARLESVGLGLGEPDPGLRWVLPGPVAWRTTQRGERYPCFLAGEPVVLGVDGLALDLDGDAVLFVHGPDGLSTLPLPVAERAWPRLSGLAPGRYLASLRTREGSIAPVTVGFEVVASLPPPPRAAWSAEVETKTVQGAGQVVRMEPLDLSGGGAGGAEEPRLSLRAPPGWTVRARWEELRVEPLLSLSADPDGVVDLAPLLQATADRRRRRPVGDLVLDLGELGALVLPHARAPEPEALRAALEKLVQGRGAEVARLRGAYQVLWPRWVEPVCRDLGYDPEPIDAERAGEPPDHAAVWALRAMERVGERIEPERVRVLVLVEDVQRGREDAMRSWMDQTCSVLKVRRAIVTDGMRWTTHERGSRLGRRVWELPQAVHDLNLFEELLGELAVGV